MKNFEVWYDKNYKKLLIIPLLLISFSLIYMAYFYSENSDFLKRDVSLIGGTSVTIETEVSQQDLMKKLPGEFSNIDIRSLEDNSGKQKYLLITTSESREKTIKVLEESLEIKLTEENSSVEYTSGSLGEEFYNQLLRAMLFAFLLMSLVVFITFGESKLIKVYSSFLTIIALKLTFPTISQISFLVGLSTFIIFFYGLYISKSKNHRFLLTAILIISMVLFIFPYYPFIFLIVIICIALYTFYSAPSIAVLISAFADIVFTIVTINLSGMRISSGGIVALLMLIGYSVGTDILLTSRVLRRKNESVNSACFGAFKTGITMTLTAISSIFVGLFFVYQYETVLNQIFIILLIGLFYDIVNTWLTNVWIIKWYAESKNKYDLEKK